MNRARRGCVHIAAALLSLALVVPASPANAAVLLSVRATIAPGRDARVALTFDSGTPNFRVYGNGTNDVTLVLVRTTPAPNSAATIAGRDSLRSITIDPVGDSVNVTFHESVAANLAVTLGSGQSLIATISPAPTSSAPRVPETLPTALPTRAPVVPDTTEMELVPLKYADVSEIVGLLAPGQQIASNDQFSPQEQSFGSGGLYNSGGFGGTSGLNGGLGAPSQTVSSLNNANAVASGQSLGQQINETIGVDRRLNAIVLTGSPATIARLKQKIAMLDVPLPTVLLETQVVELTDHAAHDVGIDFTNAGGPTVSATYELKSLNTGTGTVNLQAAIFAQVSKGEGRVIARPRIVAQSGGSAQILTGDALPIVTSIAVSGVNALSQQVQYVNVGVSLQISPRISTDGYVTSHIFSEVSSVTGYSQGYPTLSQREATTAATVRDGEAFVIGGLLQQNDISNLAKVPGIGDLPLIGSIFRVRHETRQSTNLYIIVVPRILTNGNPVPPGVAR